MNSKTGPIRRLHERYAAKFAAETISREEPEAIAPTDDALKACLDRCVRPARKEEYQAIRAAFFREYGWRWDEVQRAAVAGGAQRQPWLAASAALWQMLDERDAAYLAQAQEARYESEERPQAGDWAVRRGELARRVARVSPGGFAVAGFGVFHLALSGETAYSAFPVAGGLGREVAARLVFTGRWEEAHAMFSRRGHEVYCQMRVRVFEEVE